MTLRALLFDVYGTLLDVHGLTGALEAVAPGQGGTLSALWRQKQIDYTRLRTMSDRYGPFDQDTADALVAAYTLTHSVNVSINPFAQICDLVHKGDLHGQE